MVIPKIDSSDCEELDTNVKSAFYSGRNGADGNV
jgi:hypothetical protein